MNFKLVIVLVLVLAVVAIAARSEKRKAKKDRGNREGKRMNTYKHCKPITHSYTTCTDGNMTITKTSENTDTACQSIPQETVPCVQTTTRESKKDANCRKTMTIDRTACGTGDIATAQYTKTKTWSGCKTKDGQPVDKTKELKFSCQTGEACKYRRGGSWSDCDPVTNMKRREHPLKRGDPSICEPVKIVEKRCKRKKRMQTGCKYKMGQWSECDGATNIKTMVKTLKRGDPNTCPSTQVIEKICKRQHKGLRTNCKYKKLGRWGACDLTTGVRSREVTLKKGDPEICPPKKTVTKPCRKRGKSKKGKGKGCVYEKQPWSPCNAATNTVSRTLTLKEGDPNRCNVTKSQVKKCKNKHLRPHVCKYRRTSWEECDPTTNMRVMVKTLKRGDPAQCEPTQSVERKCKGKKNTNVCKYKYEDWSKCDLSTNTMTRRQVLKSGPATCQPVKEYSKRCKKPCKFENGNWTECDPGTNQMRRVDTLKKATDPSCPETRVLTKKCGKNGKDKKCVYDHGTWSDCDTSDSPVRTRTQQLISGGPNCQPEKITTKSCTKKNGEVRCFYGPWSEYDACMNGVQKKRRRVVQGGQDCDLKSVKMKPC